MNGKLLWFLVIAAIAGGAYWAFQPGEVQEISEVEAKDLADKSLLQFCMEEKEVCPDYIFKGREPSADKRFFWSFRFLNDHGTPWKQVIVFVGKQGDTAFQVTAVKPPEPGAVMDPAPSGAAAPGSPPAEAGGPEPAPRSDVPEARPAP